MACKTEVETHARARAMIAVTCSACRLRFEAAAAERRLHGADIMCPACDAGEPILLDLDGRAQTAPREAAGRIKVTPPPFDLAAPVQGMGMDEEMAEIEMPTPIYVDFDVAERSPPGRRAFARHAASTFASVALLAVLAFGIAWPVQTTILDEARAVVATLVGPASQAVDPDDEIVTAGISSLPQIVPLVQMKIARVSTELAETDEGRVLSVRADIRNEGAETALAPALRVSIRSLDGIVLHRWTQRHDDATIDAGETRALVATTTRIPEGAGDVKVDFADR